MTTLPTPSELPMREPVDEVQGATVNGAADLSNDTIDARARLCFRGLALCLTAMVLILNAVSLQAVVGAFLGHAQGTPFDSPQTPDAGMMVEAGAAVSHGAAAQEFHRTVVAVISILLIGEVVLTLGLVRATFSMRINADAHVSPEREAPTGGHALPGVELLKAVTEAFGTVLKGLPKR